ncbi:MAG: APC family permease [Succiniclasticum sp.]|nr:APC family permease [Succiniclasticum sp.]
MLDTGTISEKRKDWKALLKAWSFSFACAVGWGAFVMPGTFYLKNAGFWGSILALAFGTVAIILIALNYHFVGNSHKGPGGIYRLVALSLSHGNGFAAGWAIGLAYLCCFALNARALAMLLRTITEEAIHYQFRMYLIPNNVLLVDAILIVFFLCLFAHLNIRGMRRIAHVQLLGALLLIGGIILLSAAVILSGHDEVYFPSLAEETAAHNEGLFPMIMRTFVLIPWAYVGFDSVSKVHKEIIFPKKRMAGVMIFSVLCISCAYVLNIIMGVYGLPMGTAFWPEILERMSGLPGVQSYPVALAAQNAMGKLGIVLFYCTAISATVTGLVGFSVCTSRIVSQMAQAKVLPAVLGEIDPKYNTPRKGILIITVLAGGMILLLNSYAFIEDLASFSTAIGYGYISISAVRIAWKRKRKLYLISGIGGILICGFWILLMLIPFAGLQTSISRNGIACITLWCFLGIAAYSVFSRTPE